MIGNERGDAMLAPRRIDDTEAQHRPPAVHSHGRRGGERLVDPTREPRVHGVPPRAPAEHDAQQHHAPHAARDPAAPHAAPVRLQAGRQRRLADRRRDNRERPEEQERAERGEPRGHGFLELQPPRGDRLHRHDGGAPARGPRHGHLHAVRAAGHEPQGGCVERGVSRNDSGGVRWGWRGDARIPIDGQDGHGGRAASVEHPHGDLRQSRDDARRAHDHADAIRAGLPLVVGVRAADVRREDDDHRRQRRDPPGETHRLTRARPFPHHSPTRVETMASPAANVSFRGVTGSPWMFQKRCSKSPGRLL